MALVPYRPTYSQSLSGPMMPMTRYTPRSRFSRAVGFTAPLAVRRTPYKRRYNNKFNLLNTKTNPVYPRPEVKYFDQTYGILGTPIFVASDGTSLQSLNSLPVGTAPNNRIGSQVAIKNVYYQFVVNFNSTPAPIVVRHMLIWDKQSNGAQAAAGDVLSNTGSMVVSPMNLFNKERFVVLADDRVTLSPQGENIRFMSGIRTINQKAQYTGTTSTIATSGNLFVFFVSDELTGGTTPPSVYGTWRIRYIDN